MKILIVIPHHTREDLLQRVLAAVPNRPVLVVDDSPAGMSLDVSSIRTPGSQGFARAANQGLACAEEEGFTHVLLLNDDAIPEPGCIDALQDAWEPGVGAIGPVLVGDHGVESAGMAVQWWGRIQQKTAIPHAPRDVDALSGACLLVPSSARFDPDFPHGFEDLELCLRVRNTGQRVVLLPAAQCWHLGGATVSRTSPRAQRHAVYGHLRFLKKRRYVPIVMGLAMAQVLREGGPLSRFRGVFGGVRDFVQGEFSGGSVSARAARMASSSAGSIKTR